MTEREYKVYVTPDGRQTVVDPDFDFIPLLPEDFKIISQPPPYDFVPSYQRTRKIVVPGLSAEDLSQINTHDLWKMHDRALKEGAMSSLSSGDLNLLDLKIELARREIQNCKLCGWMCAVNRFVQKGTYCGLEAEAFYSSLIAHIAEEPVITPCMMIKLLGCSLRCKTCNASEGLNLEQGKKLTKSVWDEMKEINGYEKTIALQLFGGNPDESVFSILRVLKGLSGDFKKPIVWNNHGYGSKTIYRMLQGVVDIWMPDFKYGNNMCGREVSGVLDYWDIAVQGIEQIINHDVKVIIRILLLPGHVDCCYKNILEWLSSYSDKIFVSIIDNYIPDWKALQDPNLNRMVPAEEIERIRDLITYYGLRDVWDNAKDFWR